MAAFECAAIRRFVRDTPPAATARLAVQAGGVRLEVEARTYAGDANAPARVCEFAADAVRAVAALPFARPAAPRVVVHVAFAPFAKRWCVRDTRAITPCHVNSGLTSFGQRAVTVTVYRRECGYKVLLHELLHAFRVHELVADALDGEAVVESVALLLYLLMLAQSDEDARAMLEAERAWMRAQVRHLLAHRWTTTTNTRAYYVLKAGLLAPAVLPLFLRWLFGGPPAEWPHLRAAALRAAEAMGRAGDGGCISMRMTLHRASCSRDSIRLFFPTSTCGRSNIHPCVFELCLASEKRIHITHNDQRGRAAHAQGPLGPRLTHRRARSARALAAHRRVAGGARPQPRVFFHSRLCVQTQFAAAKRRERTSAEVLRDLEDSLAEAGIGVVHRARPRCSMKYFEFLALMDERALQRFSGVAWAPHPAALPRFDGSALAAQAVVAAGERVKLLDACWRVANDMRFNPGGISPRVLPVLPAHECGAAAVIEWRRLHRWHGAACSPSSSSRRRRTCTQSTARPTPLRASSACARRAPTFAPRWAAARSTASPRRRARLRRRRGRSRRPCAPTGTSRSKPWSGDTCSTSTSRWAAACCRRLTRVGLGKRRNKKLSTALSHPIRCTRTRHDPPHAHF